MSAICTHATRCSWMMKMNPIVPYATAQNGGPQTEVGHPRRKVGQHQKRRLTDTSFDTRSQDFLPPVGRMSRVQSPPQARRIASPDIYPHAVGGKHREAPGILPASGRTQNPDSEE